MTYLTPADIEKSSDVDFSQPRIHENPLGHPILEIWLGWQWIQLVRWKWDRAP